MKTSFVFAIFLFMLFKGGVVAQTPEKISYQAIVRDNQGELVINKQIGVRISILEGNPNGEAVYIEAHEPKTNDNGLISIQIGGGFVVLGTVGDIAWSRSEYFIKTEIDPTGSSGYSISGTSQLISVPYALHAQTAENLTGKVEETDPVFKSSVAIGISQEDTANWNRSVSLRESDPDFNASVASGITSFDTANWNKKYTYDIETDPIFSVWDKTTGIVISENQVSDLGNYLETETDPFYGVSIASGITAVDTANWNKNYTGNAEADPVFGKWDKSKGIVISESQIIDFGSYIETETDPVFEQSVAKGITEIDTANWNNYYSNYKENDPLFSTWDKSSGISISVKQIEDIDSYAQQESDPVFASSVASSITSLDTAKWNSNISSLSEKDPLFGLWDKSSGIVITENQITDMGNYLEAESDPIFKNWDKSSGIIISKNQISDWDNMSQIETDPIYMTSVASSITSLDTARWNSEFTTGVETDPIFALWDKRTGITILESQISDFGAYIQTEQDPEFKAWNKSTGISIRKSQISDLGSYVETESDPIFHNWDKSTGIIISKSQVSDFGTYIQTEQDPEFTAWNKSTGITIRKSQISDLGTYVQTEVDPIYSRSVASSITSNNVANWNNKQEPLTAGNGISIEGSTISLTEETSSTHYVGELYGGGVVFWVDHTGEHGLVISMIDINKNQDWSNVTDAIIGTTNDWDGAGNTTFISGQSGHASSAAKICEDFTNIDYGTGIFNDWYLPSIAELNHVWNNFYEIQKALSNDGNTSTIPLERTFYWSSTEKDSEFSWGYYFDFGFTGFNYKIYPFYVRAVRAF